VIVICRCSAPTGQNLLVAILGPPAQNAINILSQLFNQANIADKQKKYTARKDISSNTETPARLANFKLH